MCRRRSFATHDPGRSSSPTNRQVSQCQTRGRKLRVTDFGPYPFADPSGPWAAMRDRPPELPTRRPNNPTERQNGQIARQNAPFTATVESRVIAWFSFDLIQTVRGPSKHHAVAVPRLGYDTPVNCGRSARTPICWTHLKEKARVYPGEYRDRLPAMWELFPLLTGPTASILTA